MVGDPGGEEGLPVTTLAEFVAYAKARPGALNFGTTGYGSFAHLVSEVFMQQTGIAMQHVQYKGGSQATTDLLAGAIDAHMMSSAVGAGQAENPRLKMLAVASKRRLPSIPRCRPWRRRACRASTRPRGSACSGRPACRRRSASGSRARSSPWRASRPFRQNSATPASSRSALDAPATARDVPRRGRALDRVHQGARAGGEGAK